MPGTVSEELVDRAQRDGFVWEPGSVPLATIRALREVVLRVCDELGWLDPRAPLGDGVPKPGIGGFQTSDPAWVALQQQVLASPEFAAAGAAPGLRARVDALCDGAVLAGQGDLCRVVFPGDAPTPAHRDDSYTRLGRQGWTAWLPLGDCPAALGPLSVLPGSHLRDADGAAEAAWYVADLRAGDALLFSHRTLHRALPNRTARLRLSVEYRYRADPPVTTASAAG